MSALVLSLHDVSARTFPVIQRMTDELLALDPRLRLSLLVIPDHHREGHSFRRSDLLYWLQEMQAGGHEIIIHGYYHQRDPRPRETLRDRIVTRFYTAGEGEFYDIGHSEATRRLARAQEEFAGAGLRPVGFIAPAWLLGAEGERAVRDRGLAYTTRLGGIIDFRNRRHHRSQSLVWSVRAPWRRQVSLLWNAHLFRRLRSAPLLRIGLHPVDHAWPAIWSQIIQLTRSALATRHPHTYESYLAS